MFSKCQPTTEIPQVQKHVALEMIIAQ